MADGTTSPLDAALDSIERESLGGSAPESPATGGDPFASPAPEESTQPKPRRGGRKPDPNSRRSRAGKYDKDKTQSAPEVQTPPPAQTTPVYPSIPVAAVAESIRQLDEKIAENFGTKPLTQEEALAGGGVFAPIVDHYMPLLAEKGGMWVPAMTWVLMAYGPRVYDVLDRRQKQVATQQKGFTQGARSGDNGVRAFPAPNEESAEHPAGSR